jgi:Leucine-rich repeat (LRR) protein
MKFVMNIKNFANTQNPKIMAEFMHASDAYYPSMSLSRVPDDIIRTVVEFATQSLRAVLSLQLVSRHFHAVMKQPKMLWHVRAHFNDFQDGQQLGVGLRHLSIPGARSTLASLALVRGLRTLHMPGWRINADMQHLQNMTQLEELDLSRAVWLRKLESLPVSLKRLNINGTPIQRLPYMPNLEELDVSGNGVHRSVSDSIILSTCPNLRSLKMADSASEMLDLRCLAKLQELDISSGDLTHLQVGHQLHVLTAERCAFLREIPDLPNLTELNVMFCESLVVLPQLPNLLKLHNYGSPTRPNISMSQLRELDASELTFEHFECLAMFPKLEKLDLQGCEFVEQDFTKLPNLTSLILEPEASASLYCLPTSLTHLQLDGEVSDRHMAALPTLTNLKTLLVTSEHCTDASMMWISRIPSLEFLSVDNASHWSISSFGVSYLENLPNLRHLELLYCTVDDLAVVSRVANLEILDIDGIDAQLNLEPLANMKRLTRLDINNCALESLRGVNQIARLDVLSITDCRLVCDDIVDLIPAQLTYLKLALTSMRLVGKLWADFVKNLKTSHPWMEIHA